jgi:acetolactate synthase-1/2/3 large subunit
MARLQKRLWAAERPMMVLGGGRWSEAAVAATVRFAERFDLPVAPPSGGRCCFRPTTRTTPATSASASTRSCSRASATPTSCCSSSAIPCRRCRAQSYTLFRSRAAAGARARAAGRRTGLGKVYQPALAINASPQAFAAALEGLQPPTSIAWGEATRDRPRRLSRLERDGAGAGAGHGPDGGEWWRRCDAAGGRILTNGAGNYAIWLHRFHRFRRYGTQVAPTSGSMGYGVPAAIAAKLALSGAQRVGGARRRRLTS